MGRDFSVSKLKTLLKDSQLGDHDNAHGSQKTVLLYSSGSSEELLQQNQKQITQLAKQSSDNQKRIDTLHRELIELKSHALVK